MCSGGDSCLLCLRLRTRVAREQCDDVVPFASGQLQTIGAPRATRGARCQRSVVGSGGGCQPGSGLPLDEDGHEVAHAPPEPVVNVAHREPHGFFGYLGEAFSQTRTHVLERLLLVHLDHGPTMTDLGHGGKGALGAQAARGIQPTSTCSRGVRGSRVVLRVLRSTSVVLVGAPRSSSVHSRHARR